MPTRERPVVEATSPSRTDQFTIVRGIISPCKGCKNNIQPRGFEGNSEQRGGPVCPKRILYKLKELYGESTDEFNWEGPVFDANLLSINPVWPGLKDYGNGYAYVFIATYEDNVDTGLNPNFDTERIICRGPMLIKTSEREWHQQGHLEQGDPVIAYVWKFFVEGQEFQGFAEPGQIWQVARGYAREIDRNVGKSMSANGSI